MLCKRSYQKEKELPQRKNFVCRKLYGYNLNKYPFQRQYLENEFALKCAGYEQVGSYIYPYKLESTILTQTNIGTIEKNTTKSVLLTSDMKVDTLFDMNNSYYKFINGNGKKLSGTGANILKNSS